MEQDSPIRPPEMQVRPDPWWECIVSRTPRFAIGIDFARQRREDLEDAFALGPLKQRWWERRIIIALGWKSITWYRWREQ